MQVFVYGTLKRGGGLHPVIGTYKPLNIIPAKVRGYLYDLGPFPAYVYLEGDVVEWGRPGDTSPPATTTKGSKLRPGVGSPWVLGEMVEFEKSDVLKELDRIEGFHHHMPLFNRVTTKAYDCSPQSRYLGTPWVYTMSADNGLISISDPSLSMPRNSNGEAVWNV